MANDRVSSTEDLDTFLEYLLRSALTAPGAATSPSAGRILARLIAVGASEGGDRMVSPYLTTVPGQDATFEVRAYRAGNLSPTAVRAGLGATAALTVAFRLAREGDAGIEVVSEGPQGLERCVLVRDSTGEFEFRFPGPETLTGAPEACAMAIREWANTLAAWRAAMMVRSAAGVPSTPGTSASPANSGAGAWPPQQDQGHDGHDGATRPAPAGRTGSAPPGTAVDRQPMEPDSLVAVIRDCFANLTVEVDLSQVEHLIRRALDNDRRDLVEPLARRLSVLLGESLDIPDPRVLVESVVPLVPRADEVADLVAARIAALLSETILRRRQGEIGGQPSPLPSIMVAIEHLQVQLDGVRDQVRRSTGVLETFGARLDAGDRRSAIAERIGASLDHEMHRLAQRIEEQVAELATGAPGGSELSDGLARLTRKLRQSAAQLDRVLVRLDEVLGHSGIAPD